MNELELARHIALLVLAISCAYTDMARGKLYNPVTLGALALGLGLAMAQDVGTPGWANLNVTVAATFLGGGLLCVLVFTGGMGSGDMKFMAAVGALSGSWIFVLWVLTYAALLGAAIGIGVLIWERRLLKGLKGSSRMLFRLKVKKPSGPDDPAPTTIPFGIAIAGGVVWAWMEFVALK